MRSTYVHDTGYTFRFVACGGRGWTHFHWDRRRLHGRCCGSEVKKHFPICCRADERLGWLVRIDTQYWAGPFFLRLVFFWGVHNGIMPDHFLLWCCMENDSTVYTFSIFSTCRAPAFSSNTIPSASTSLSPTSTTLSPKAAAISSRVLCLVSLLTALVTVVRSYYHLRAFDDTCIEPKNSGRVRVGVR